MADIKTSTPKEVKDYYDKIEPATKAQEGNETTSLGTRANWPKTPPYMAILLGLSLTSTLFATLPALATDFDPPSGDSPRGGRGTTRVIAVESVVAAGEDRGTGR